MICRNHEYYEDGPTRTLTGAENYELPSASRNVVLKQEDHEVTHGSQNQYGFPHSPQLSDPSFPQSQTPQQTQISTPFLNVMVITSTVLIQSLIVLFLCITNINCTAGCSKWQPCQRI